jgi:hypothetical protein
MIAPIRPLNSIFIAERLQDLAARKHASAIRCYLLRRQIRCSEFRRMV